MWVKKNVVSEKFLVQEIWVNKILVQTFLGPNNFRIKKNLVLENKGKKILVDPKKYLARQILDPKNVGTKKCWVQERLGSNKFFVPKKFGSKFV